MMNKLRILMGSLALCCTSVGAQAITLQLPGQAPPTQPPAFGQLAPVPGTDGLITSPSAAVADRVFIAGLSGFAEVPPRETDATGHVAVTLNPDGMTLHYRLAVANLENVVAAHLHLGLPDENGPIIVPLLGQGAPGDAATPPASGPAEGVIAEGDIGPAQLTGPLAGTPMVVLMELMRSGAVYANVHTSTYPAGEIRGQVEGIGPNAASLQLLQGMPGSGLEDGGDSGGGSTPPAAGNP